MGVLRNPILQRELIYQRRSTLPRLARYENYILAIITGILLLLIVFASEEQELLLILLLAIWIFHIAMAIRLVISGVDVVSREYANATWESLVLTGIDTRKIFFGKWLSVLKRVWIWAVASFVLRMGLTVAVYAESNPTYSGSDWRILLLLCPFLCAVFAVLEILASTGLGMATSLIMRDGRRAIALASILRVAPVFIGGLLVIVSFFADFMIDGYDTSLLEILAGISEPGVLIASFTTSSLSSSYNQRLSIGLVVGFLLLIGLLIVSMGAGLIAIRRNETRSP